MEQKLLIKHYLADQKESTLSQANDNIEAWVSYWRANPHRFITEYLGGELYDFQKVLLYGMDKYPYFIYAASRGLAKTSVGAWFAVERAILYPRQPIS